MAAEDDRPTAGREEEQDEEEALPDWSQFAKLAKAHKGDSTAATPFIPRRGEKDFEPINLTAASATEKTLLSKHQLNLLAQSRNNLYTAISSGYRSHSSRYHNSFTWRPDLDGGRACSDSDTTYGIHFATMGRFHPLRRRVELLPEEALYLVERGAIELWSVHPQTGARLPMTVQQAWAQLIGHDELTIERFQIYAQLKRLGFSVLRARRKEIDLLGTFERKPRSLSLVLAALAQRLRSLIATCWARLAQTFSKPALYITRRVKAAEGQVRSLIHGQRWTTYNAIFTRLQIVPTGHDYPLRPPVAHRHDHPARKARQQAGDESPLSPHPYQVFWHVYKPITKFKKSKPPEPDFKIVVINGSETAMPDLFEFASLFNSLPIREPPLPKPRAPPRPSRPAPAASTPDTTWLARLKSYVPLLGSAGQASKPARKPSPYPKLKVGRRDIIVAIADHGTTSYIRFSESEFGKLPWSGQPRSA